MPILASTTFVNAYGKSGVVAVQASALPMNSTLNSVDICIVKYNTSGVPLWSARIGGPDTDEPFGIVTDASNNVYVTGYFSSGSNGRAIYAFNFDGTQFPTVLIPTSSSFDAFLIKYNSNGVVQWLTRVGGTGSETGYGVAVDSNQDVYLTGQATGVVTAYSSNQVAFGLTLQNSGNGDAFLIKYNSSGIVQWLTRIASTGDDYGTSVVTDSSNNVYVGGVGGSGVAVTAFSFNNTAGGLAFSPTIPVVTGTSVAYLVKYNSSGTVQWVAYIDGYSPGASFMVAIAVDSSGNIYMTGAGASKTLTAYSFNGTATGLAFSPTLANAGVGEAFVVKYNTSGTVQWITRISSANKDSGYGIAVDSSGSAYVVGQNGDVATSGEVTAFSYDGSGTGLAFSPTLPSRGNGDTFIVKYNTNGVVQWLAQVGSASIDRGLGISLDSSANAYIIGLISSGTVTAYNAGGTSFGSRTTLGSATFVVKYNTNGAVQWLTTYEGDGARAITTDSGGNSYATSRFQASQFSVYGQTLSVFNTLTNAGNTDAIFVKYSSLFVPQWAVRIAGANADAGYDVVTDSSQNVYMIGISGGTVTLFNANGATSGITINARIFVVKYDSSGVAQWAARIGDGLELPSAVACDSTGSIYVVGQTGSGTTMTAYSSNGTAIGSAFSPALANSGLNDAFIVKYNTNGAVQWVARLASTAADFAYTVAVDSSNNVYVGGFGGSGAQLNAFNANNGSQFGTFTNSGLTDAFLVKYNSSGTGQWIAGLKSSGSDQIFDIAVDTNGDIYGIGTAGGTSITTNVVNTAGSTVLTFGSAGNQEGFVVKYNTSGTPLWVSRIASTGLDTGLSISTDSSNNVYAIVRNNGQTSGFSVFNTNGTQYLTQQFITSSSYIIKYNSSGVVQWVCPYPGGGNFSSLNNVFNILSTDPSGNTYIIVNASGLTNAADSTGGARLALSTGINIVKYNKDGYPVDSRLIRASTASLPNGRSVYADSLGNVYAAVEGFSATSTVVMNGDSTVYKVLQSSRGSTDIFLVKYSSNTTPLWVAQIGGPSADTAFDIRVDGSGNVYIIGACGNNTIVYNADGTVFTTVTTDAFSRDAILVKYDTNGTVQWLSRIHSSATDTGYSVTTDSTGSVYVTGAGGDVMTVRNADGTAFGTTIPNLGGGDAFIAKYNASGVVQWIARVGSTLADTGFATAIDTGDNFYIAGQGGSAVAINVYNAGGTTIARTLGNTGGSDAFVVKYNSAGTEQWSGRIGSTATDIAYAVATDSSANVYVTGIAGGNATTVTAFSVGDAPFSVTFTSTTGGDVFVVKYNSVGTVQWLTRIASTTAVADTGFGIATDSSGNVYVIGSGLGIITSYSYNGTSAGVAFSPNLPNFGGGDAFLVKFNTNGVVQWNIRIGSSSSDVNYGIRVTPSGDIFVSGDATNNPTDLTFFSVGSTFGTLPITGANLNTQSFLARYDTNGICQWVSALGGGGADSTRAVDIDSSSNIYAVGSFSGTYLTFPSA